MQDITSGIGLFETLYVIQEFVVELTGRGRMVEI